VHVDDALVVVNKPSGLLSVPGRGEDKQDCASLRVQALYPDALIVHRLDMATSGLLVMARGIGVQRQLNAAFAQRQVFKRYEAVANGLLSETIGQWFTIDLPICVDWERRPLRIIDAELGKPSQTRVCCTHLDLAMQTSRVALEPVTGRSHQLRVHLQALGHPIVGDALYADPVALAKAPRLFLHASTLAFCHPNTGQPMEFQSPTPF
jgi:tRNA pseudouridine32 synthase/23S rRNA pseudouridine746 synthase